MFQETASMRKSLVTPITLVLPREHGEGGREGRDTRTTMRLQVIGSSSHVLQCQSKLACN